MAPPGPTVTDDLVSTGVLGGEVGNRAIHTVFPTWALQPKRETGARSFLLRNPEFDGRGTIIAIFDSGVDPGAGGLQLTSDGKRKVIDRIDASGAGDVEMSDVVEPKDGIVKGLSGRELILPADCVGHTNYRVGLKRAFTLYPRSLRDRIVKERQEKIWDPKHKPAVVEAHKKLQDLNAENNGNAKQAGMAKLEKENVEAEYELLNSMEKKFKEVGGDVGPVYDIVLFQDNSSWVCLIDTSEVGHLDRGIRLRPFRESGDYAPLTKEDKLNVSVNVYDDGKIVQIVSMCSSHGTHVASIAAANFPDDSDRNGIAPGAQIVSITIGDARLNSMETGTALVRAMTHVMQAEHYKVDVINMSYGEHSHWSNTGRVGELMGEVINKHGIIWVASAGNNGPALSTVGTPPDISTNTVIGVGAYVSPEMMIALYSTREKLPGTPYTWTSRGPTIDGDRGVSICAPGGAITSVPHFTLRGSQLMNGTSMASPHVCGAVSLMVSGLKQSGIKYSPFSVKRALINSALKLPNSCHFAQGHGLLQVEEAYAHLCKYSDAMERDVRFAVTCNSGSKGIHIRKNSASLKNMEIPVKVEPVYLNDEMVDSDSKINFNVKFSLVSTESWAQCPDHLDLMYVCRHFLVHIDPSGLKPGVHSAYIKAFDVKEPQKGQLFEVCITVVVPEPLSDSPRPNLSVPSELFQSGGLKRHFVEVPVGASWAVFRLNSLEQTSSSKFVLHTVQLVPKTVVHAWEQHKMINLAEQGEFVCSIPVKGSYILEVCLAKWWAHIGNIQVSYSLTFHGLSPQSRELHIHGAEGITRFDVSCDLHHEELQPEIKLKNLVQNFRPYESKVVVLGSRDVIPPNRNISELRVAYNFSIAKSTEIIPNFPLLSNVLYESEFESQLWMLYNSHKQLVACGDAFPSKWATKVEKEEYTLRAHIRSESREVLEKLTDLPLLLSIKLASSTSLDIYTSFAQASTGGKKTNSSFTMSKGSALPLYIAPLNGDKYMKNYTQGQFLTGMMTLPKDEFGKKVDSIKVTYILSEPPKKDKNNQKSKPKTELNFEKALVDFKLDWLLKLDWKSEESKRLFGEMKQDPKANLTQVYIARLTALDLDKVFIQPEINEEKISEAMDLCNLILDQIKLEDLLSHGAIKNDLRADAPDIKKEMEKQKGWFIEAMTKKGMCLCVTDRLPEATDLLFDLVKLVDVTDSKVVPFTSLHAEKMKHFGRAMKILLGQLENKPGALEVEQRLIRLASKLQWTHIESMGQKSLELRYPGNYEPF